MTIININKKTQQIRNPLFEQVLDHITINMNLRPERSEADSGNGYATMVYTDGDPEDETIFTVQLMRGRPIQITAVVRGVQIGTVLYTSEKLPDAFQILIRDVL